MFKDFLTGIIALAFFGTVCEMIMPKGAIEKYFKLAFGFMMMFILISPVAKGINGTKFEFSFDELMSNEEISAKNDYYILKMHEENIQKQVLEKVGDNAQVFVEVFTDGTVKSVTIRDVNVHDTVINELKTTLGCENITNIQGDDIDN